MYVFINRLENKVVSISKYDQNIDGLEKFIVSDDFDFSKIVFDDSGQEIKIDFFLTAEEFLDRYESDYKQKRISLYPQITEQLDMIYWDMKNSTSEWINLIDRIKMENPKS